MEWSTYSMEKYKETIKDDNTFKPVMGVAMDVYQNTELNRVRIKALEDRVASLQEDVISLKRVAIDQKEQAQ